MAGVPGTGKTMVGSKLAKRLGCRFTTLSWLVLEKGLWISYDRGRRSFIVDYSRLVDLLKAFFSMKDCIVFETHWLEPFSEIDKLVQKVLLLRCHPIVLYKRLSRRGWPRRKIAENVEAELVGVVASEALEYFSDRVVELDTTRLSVYEAVEGALRLLSSHSRCCIDWLEKIEEKELQELIGLIG